ncbi:MAG TPA: HutD-family protein [Clostridium sp.]|nr:HutD-family protein [Clostridium sp.]
MIYDFKLIKNADYTPTYWSGGSATELITYPQNSSFAIRNFLWRLGFAKIDIDTSTFSSLPGIKRHLMVTDGSMTLTHKDRYSKKLTSYSQDFFMGDWITTTEGRCSVFNLMTRENYDGELSHITLYSNSTYNFTPTNISTSQNQIINICFYAINGLFNINVNNISTSVNARDLFTISINDYNPSISFDLYNNTQENTDIIAAIIYKTK